MSKVRVSNVAARIRGLATRSLVDEYPGTLKVTAVAPTKPEFHTALVNGIRVGAISEPSSTAVIKIGILGGSSAETLAEKGSALVLASGAFDGNLNKSGVAVVREFEDIGAVVGATSDREKITYTIKVPNEHFSRALELAAVNVKSPIHRNYIVERAKVRAKIAYDLFHANPSARLNEYLHEAAYGENTPLGGSIYPDDFDHLEASDVIHFRNSNFTAENLAIAVHGNLPVANLTGAVESHFHNVLAHGKAAKFSAGFTGGEVRVRDSHVCESHVGLAFGVASGKDKANKVLRALLRQKVSSKASHVQVHLHSKVHHYENNHSLTKSFYNSYLSGGLFGLTFKGDAKYVSSALQESINELKKIASGAASTADIQLAKKRLHVDDSLNGESLKVSTQLYNSVLAGGSKIDRSYDSVTDADVAEAAKAALKSTPGYAVFGTTYQVPNLNTVAKWLA